MRDDVEEDRGRTVNQEAAGQGRYVVPFTMSREEEAVGMELSRAHLTQLMVECAAESMDESWTRVKSRKSTGVTLWEKRSKRESKKKKWVSIPGNISEMGLEEDTGPVIYSVRSSKTVDAPLDTVLKILDASVTSAHRSFTRLIYGNLVADTSVLFHSSTPTPDFMTKNENDNVETLAVRWSFESLKAYEDIFLKLCENSASVRNSKFVALTLYTRQSSADKNQQNEMEASESTIHYLKVKGSTKLVKTAANMRCCDPVLEMNRPVITRNTWALDGKSPIHPSGFAFRQLPIVMGPQQARFYAGVPLIDSKKRYRYGALAVFDTTISAGADDDLPMKKTVQALEVCAREAVMAVDERRKELELRTFLEAPLIQLRQSEPALNLSMDISQSSARWRDIESLDGDSDNDDEDQRRLEYEHRNARTKSDPEFDSDSSSVGKARVEYFRNKMQELVRQAQDTQAQLVE
ncbi:ATPase of Hsp90 chaperone/DNA topoisomerase II/histidine Kinase, partial [Phytophthora palmivora]